MSDSWNIPTSFSSRRTGATNALCNASSTVIRFSGSISSKGPDPTERQHATQQLQGSRLRVRIQLFEVHRRHELQREEELIIIIIIIMHASFIGPSSNCITSS